MAKTIKSRKEKHLDIIQETVSLEGENPSISGRSKYNLSYFDSGQTYAASFKSLREKDLFDLLEKFRHWSKEPLVYWENQSVGKGGKHVLEFYPGFPSVNFAFPRHIPYEVEWGRFRLNNKSRLIGFRIPETHDGKVNSETGICYDRNTFYVVFYDQDHKFYASL